MLVKFQKIFFKFFFPPIISKLTFDQLILDERNEDEFGDIFSQIKRDGYKSYRVAVEIPFNKHILFTVDSIQFLWLQKFMCKKTKFLPFWNKSQIMKLNDTEWPKSIPLRNQNSTRYYIFLPRWLNFHFYHCQGSNNYNLLSIFFKQIHVNRNANYNKNNNNFHKKFLISKLIWNADIKIFLFQCPSTFIVVS